MARHMGEEPVGDLQQLDVNQDGKINAEDVRRVTAKMNEDRKPK
ncbi:dockerin type I domain-containing protein [Paenibacillus sp. MDMC362]